MQQETFERNPENCASEGLDCRHCVIRAAESIAALSPDLTPEAAERIFQQMFPEIDCKSMSYTFGWAYCEAASAGGVPRVPVRREGPRYRTAVA